ncbi:hypothetical protein [Palleronia caenipelagi]|uniref:hypothetical protein n=1 Tax=Palleronia caenipelagi TaxID=2489174 RepID=UPI001C8F6F22|nr:hypothetical protein [Palleronia caenipelagi]
MTFLHADLVGLVISHAVGAQDRFVPDDLIVAIELACHRTLGGLNRDRLRLVLSLSTTRSRYSKNKNSEHFHFEHSKICKQLTLDACITTFNLVKCNSSNGWSGFRILDRGKVLFEGNVGKILPAMRRLKRALHYRDGPRILSDVQLFDKLGVG